MGEIRLSSEVDARPEDIAIIENAIDEFNMRYTGDRNYRPVQIFLRDEENQLYGGITADLWGGWMHITYFGSPKRCGDKVMAHGLLQRLRTKRARMAATTHLWKPSAFKHDLFMNV